MGGVIAVAGLFAFMAFMAYAHGPGRADGKTKAVWDCGIDSCRYRNRNMHKHPASAAPD